MILERGHFGTAKVCGMRNKLLHNILIGEGEVNDDVILEELRKRCDVESHSLFENTCIIRKNDNEWEVTTERKSYVVKKEGNRLKVYEALDELRGSMITIPVAAQNRLLWQKEIGGEKSRLFKHQQRRDLVQDDFL